MYCDNSYKILNNQGQPIEEQKSISPITDTICETKDDKSMHKDMTQYRKEVNFLWQFIHQRRDRNTLLTLVSKGSVKKLKVCAVEFDFTPGDFPSL